MTRPKPKRPAPDAPRYRAESDPHISRAINRFQRAVGDKACQGTIPAYESDEAFEAYTAIDNELDAAKANLLRVIDRRMNK